LSKRGYSARLLEGLNPAQPRWGNVLFCVASVGNEIQQRAVIS
jgi:hypothetical protein